MIFFVVHNNKSTDKFVQSISLISTFDICFLESTITMLHPRLSI